MKCPHCGKEMKQGFLNARAPVLWTETETELVVLTGKGDLAHGGKSPVRKMPAALCEDCGTVVAKYR